jgi:hypothetical protein
MKATFSTFLLPIVEAAVLLTLAPRDEVSKDTIRFMKCENLVNDKRHAANGENWERGMAAYYADQDATGPYTRVAFFDMYEAKDDFFYNNHASLYGGDFFFWGGGKIASDFSSPVTTPDPP